MKVFLIYPATTNRENNAFGWFHDAAKHHDIESEVYFYDRPGITPELYRKKLPDLVLMRGYNTLLSAWYEDKGIKVINTTASMKLCRDKYLSGIALEQCGIAVPKTFSEDSFCQDSLYDDSCRGYEEVCAALQSSVFVMKMRFGSKGENVYLIDNQRQLTDALNQCNEIRKQRLALSGMNSEFGNDEEEISSGCKLIFQEYISSSFGRDIRVWVFGGKVIAHTLRYNEHSFKSNYAQGGSGRDIELPKEAAKLAVNAAEVLGLEFAGADLLYDGKGGFMVCEVNGNPGFRTASADIPERIFEILSGK